MQLQVHNAASTPGSLFYVDRGKSHHIQITHVTIGGTRAAWGPVTLSLVSLSSKKLFCVFGVSGSRLSPLPLSKLPPSCGHTIRSTRKDLILVAPYDGCFVALEVRYFCPVAPHIQAVLTCDVCHACFRRTAMFCHCGGGGYH